MAILRGSVSKLISETINHKFLLYGIYRPPNTGIELWDSIERTFENLGRRFGTSKMHLSPP